MSKDPWDDLRESQKLSELRQLNRNLRNLNNGGNNGGNNGSDDSISTLIGLLIYFIAMLVCHYAYNVPWLLSFLWPVGLFLKILINIIRAL